MPPKRSCYYGGPFAAPRGGVCLLDLQRLLAGATLCLFVSGCAHKDIKTPIAEIPRPVSPAPAAEPTARLVAQADALLLSGQAEARNGHLTRAREAFDAAVNLYLTSPGGAYADARRSVMRMGNERPSARSMLAIATR